MRVEIEKTYKHLEIGEKDQAMKILERALGIQSKTGSDE